MRSTAETRLPKRAQPPPEARDLRLPVDNAARPMSSISLTCSLCPLSHAPPPFSAQAISSNITPLDTPSTSSSFRIRAIWVEKNGDCLTKLLVPSMGSTSHRYSAFEIGRAHV